MSDPTRPLSTSQALAKFTAVLNALAGQLQLAPSAIAAPQMAELLEGRRRIALNAIKSNVTGLKMFLSEDEFPQYMAIARDFVFDLKPATVRDMQLVQKMIDNNWRQNRVSALENNMMMTGLIKRSTAQPIDGPAPGSNSLPDDGSREMISQVLAYETDCAGPNAFDKLGRHEMRLIRIGSELEATFVRRRKRLSRGLGAKPIFDPATNPAYLWYRNMALIGEDLIAARQELNAAVAAAARELDQTTPAEPATPAESQTSEQPLFCEKAPKLTGVTVHALTYAQEIGLLRDEEVQSFRKLMAA